MKIFPNYHVFHGPQEPLDLLCLSFDSESSHPEKTEENNRKRDPKKVNTFIAEIQLLSSSTDTSFDGITRWKRQIRRDGEK